MTQLISAKDLRNNFAEILNMVVYGNTNVVITRFSKPQAVLVDYDEYQRLLNPKSRFSEKEWQGLFKPLDEIRRNLPKVSQKRVEKDINEAIKYARKKTS